MLINQLPGVGVEGGLRPLPTLSVPLTCAIYPYTVLKHLIIVIHVFYNLSRFIVVLCY